MAFTHYRTGGIFLKKDDRGEADQLFTIFTKEFGKLKVLGRAIRKIKSKLRVGADIFYLSEIEFIQGKTYKTLTDAILIDKFKNLRKDAEKIDFSYKITDVLDSLTGEEEKDPKIWQLLIQTFKSLNNPMTQSLNDSITYYFLWNFFSLLGFKPELYSCPICEKKLLPETFLFVPKEGGVVCWKCFEKLKEEPAFLSAEAPSEAKAGAEATTGREKKLAKEISVDTVKILRLFLSENGNILSRIKIREENKKNLEEISENYLNFLKEEFSRMEK